MATTRTETEERAALMRRLRELVSPAMADRYVDATMEDLKGTVEDCEAQLAWYAAQGLEDMAATP